MEELRNQEFLDKLSALLKEYKAEISFEIDDIDYGFREVSMVICVNDKKILNIPNRHWVDADSKLKIKTMNVFNKMVDRFLDLNWLGHYDPEKQLICL
jgi:hypothetical protein